MYPRPGVVLCPTTILSLGLPLMPKEQVPVQRWTISVLWSMIGGTAAWLLVLPEDLGLLATGTVGGGLLLWDERFPMHKKLNMIGVM